MKTVSPQELGPALADQIRSLRRRYRRRLAQCRQHFSESAVHQLRVATRRMLATTELLDVLKVGKRRTKIQRAFKVRLDSFDALRDTQVQRRLLLGFVRRFPVAATLERSLERREQKLIKQLRCEVKSLRSGRMDRWVKRAEKELSRLEAANALTLAPRIATALDKSFRLVAGLKQRIRAERLATIHRLRIAFKHHRYLCELLQPLRPELADVDLKSMHRFQTLMGDIQDCEVLLAGIKGLIAARVVTIVGASELRQAVLARRARRVERFLQKVESLWKFQPKS